MRNMCLGITAVVVTMGMVSVGAQGRNFSGTWVVDSEKTRAAQQAATGEMVAATRAVRGTGGEVTTASAGGVGAGGTITAAGSGGGGGARARGTGSGEATSAGGGGGVAVGGIMTAAGDGAVRAVRGGGAGGVAVTSDIVISIDGNTFSTDIGGVRTSYPLDGSEVTVPVMTRSTTGATTTEAKARASWKGDTLVIETTINGPEGPVTSTASWFLEGDSLVRLTTRRTYYKKK